jgi:hypothetical protein
MNQFGGIAGAAAEIVERAIGQIGDLVEQVAGRPGALVFEFHILFGRPRHGVSFG